MLAKVSRLRELPIKVRRREDATTHTRYAYAPQSETRPAAGALYQFDIQISPATPEPCAEAGHLIDPFRQLPDPRFQVSVRHGRRPKKSPNQARAGSFQTHLWGV